MISFLIIFLRYLGGDFKGRDNQPSPQEDLYEILRICIFEVKMERTSSNDDFAHKVFEQFMDLYVAPEIKRRAR